MNHGALVAHGHPAPDGERAGQELDDECLHLEDVLDPGPVEEPDDFRNSGSCRSRLIDDEERGDDQEDQRVAERPQPGR